MKTIIKTFGELDTRELYAILRARAEVFVVEQNCVYQDLDGVDTDAYHVFTLEDGEITAYLRVFMRDSEAKTAQIGRVLTVKRGKGLGLHVMNEGIRAAKELLYAKEIYIEAQVYAIGFYEKVGFSVCSDEFLEDGIPHVKMTLTLD
jgi:ElaA protein